MIGARVQFVTTTKMQPSPQFRPTIKNSLLRYELSSQHASFRIIRQVFLVLLQPLLWFG